MGDGAINWRWAKLTLLGICCLAGCGDEAESDGTGEQGSEPRVEVALGRCYSSLVDTCIEYPLAKYPDEHWACSTYSYERVATCPEGAIASCTDAEGVTAYYHSELVANAAAPNCTEQVRLDE